MEILLPNLIEYNNIDCVNLNCAWFPEFNNLNLEIHKFKIMWFDSFITWSRMCTQKNCVGFRGFIVYENSDMRQQNWPHLFWDFFQHACWEPTSWCEEIHHVIRIPFSPVSHWDSKFFTHFFQHYFVRTHKFWIDIFHLENGRSYLCHFF